MGTLPLHLRLMGVASNGRFLGLFCAVAVAFAVSAAPARAQAQPRFSETLMPADWTSAGYVHLKTQQATELDALIQRDIDAARQGDVVAFAKGFTERRTPDEWRRAGIDQLTPAERAKLDAVVATRIAMRPANAFIPWVAKPGSAKEIKTVPRPWEVHGEVSMFVGGGSGSSFYGGSVDTWATDPTHRVSIGVGYSQVHAKGPGWGCLREPYW